MIELLPTDQTDQMMTDQTITDQTITNLMIKGVG